jgi:uncharacterized protein (TIGR02302 family)
MPSDTSVAKPAVNAEFERKIHLSRAALLLEQVWPRLWAIGGLIGLFVVVSLAGIWQLVPDVVHKLLLAVFAVGGLAAGVWLVRTPLATRDEAIRRIERRSGVPHRPASTYEDSLTASSDNPSTQALWTEHRARVRRQLARLRVGVPQARTDRYDPFAVRAVLVIGLGLLTWLVGDSAADRLRAALRLAPPGLAATARLDAWVTPPAYTGAAPVILADGARPVGQIVAAVNEKGEIEVPERSQLFVRASGAGTLGFTLEVTPDGESARRLEAKPQDAAHQSSDRNPNVAPALQSEAAEIKVELKRSAKVRVVGLTQPPWVFRVIPDTPPTIALSKEPQRLPRGSLKLTYKVGDDYGVVAAEGRITRAKPQPGDPATSWARPKANKGPRPPLERPPALSLRLPRANAKEGEAFSYHELTGHPWAGSRVRLTLMARDAAGQVGRSQPTELILPQRRFQNPIAKAVVEQRRLLVEDPRNRDTVAYALEAITMEPEGFINDRRAYLSLRSAYWRLQRDKSRAGTKSVTDQLWQAALRLEDGDLSEAERALRDAQEQLSKALQDGASDEEIQRLMNQLREALNNFMQQLERQAENQPMEFPRNLSPDNIIRQQDLERMMRDIENMARQGSRDAAQQMLSQLRDMLEQLQNGRIARGQGQSQQSQQMMQMMDQFGDIIGKQQQLLDDTFGEQQGREGQGQQGGQQQGRQGQQGQGQPGQRGQRQGRNGQGRDGQRQQQQGQGQGQGGQPGMGLGDRQGQLRDRLGQLQEMMRRNGMQSPQQLEGAERSMREAEQALRGGDLDGATQAEQQALEQLRQGAQQMAEQMMRQMRQFGQGPGGDVPLDPLGRPQRTEGPDLGTSVKVPDEIDMQRAREILEELRRRLGEPMRPQLELDYIDRLLKRF